MRQSVSLKILAVAATIAFAAPALAEPVYGLVAPAVAAAQLVRFDTATPGILTSIGTLTGVTGGQTVRGIDFRPADGRLYAISSDGGANAQLYTVNLTTGALTTFGGALVLAGTTASTTLSIDFNPMANALRIVTGGATGQSHNYRYTAAGMLVQDTDINNGANITGLAYSNNVAGASSTTLYAYDFFTDTIGSIGAVGGGAGNASPNAGIYNPIGPSGVVADLQTMDFDISGVTGNAYLSLDPRGDNITQANFYSVNLATGAATLIGGFTPGINLVDFSIAPAAVPEPETMGLFAIGLVGLVAAVRRRRSA